jgi:LuxR family maltose regulon positive regulatory protein
LRAHGQLLELRTQDLRFTSQEAAEFLNEVMRLGLSPEDIGALEARTEGWVVGLQMAALSLRGHENASDFIRAFSGSHRYVLDYLVEEVLKRQPAHIQTFLLETSILEKLNSALCDALMSEEWKQSGENGQAVLEYLESSNLFVVPLDQNRQWYRYHHLFADLLHSRLEQRSAGRAATLHMKASQWFESQGNLNQAIDHALLSKDYGRSANLLDMSSQTRVLINVFTVQKWIQQIPDEIIQIHPWIHISQSWIWLSMGKLDQIEDLLKRAEDCLRKETGQSRSDAEKEDIQGHIAMIRAYLAFFRGEPLVTIEQATLALQNVRLSNNFLRSRITLPIL